MNGGFGMGTKGCSKVAFGCWAEGGAVGGGGKQHISTHLEANRILHRLPPLPLCITLTWSSFEWSKHKPHLLAVLCVETQAITEINLLVLGVHFLPLATAHYYSHL